MALNTLLAGASLPLAITLFVVAILTTACYCALARSAFPKDAPAYVSETVCFAEQLLQANAADPEH
jgi:uncharacterized membrane protein (DUF485 family)